MKRPFVRGLYAVCNLGASWPEVWRALLSGAENVTVQAETSSDLRLQVPVGAVPDLDRALGAAPPVAGPARRLAGQVLHQALSERERRRRPAIHGGTNHGESDVLQSLAVAAQRRQEPRHSAALWRSALLDPLAEGLDEDGRLASWSYSACTSSMHALLFASLELRSGRAADAIILGVDPLNATGVAGFARAGACAARRCQPFREERDGLMVAEGAAALVLDRRPPHDGLSIRLLGIAPSCDAGHPTRPSAGGEHLEAAIRRALDEAGLEADDVGGLILHGTGTRANDAAEATAYRKLWPAGQVPATSIKGSTGHTMGAAGLFNCLTAVEASRSGLLPPSLGDSRPLDGVDLVHDGPRRMERGAPVVVNCSGFGGNNVCAVFGAAA